MMRVAFPKLCGKITVKVPWINVHAWFGIADFMRALCIRAFTIHVMQHHVSVCASRPTSFACTLLSSALFCGDDHVQMTLNLRSWSGLVHHLVQGWTIRTDGLGYQLPVSQPKVWRQ